MNILKQDEFTNKSEDLNMRHLNLQIQYYVFKKLKEKLLL